MLINYTYMIPGNFHINLVDLRLEMVDAWSYYFKDHLNNVTIYQGDFFDLECDAVVSPANSFGFMNGGLDEVISNKLGWDVQERLQNQIKMLPNQELLVGDSIVVPTIDNDDISYVISCPTMRVPESIVGTINPYLSSKAAFIVLRDYDDINTITISGMGTGVGGFPFKLGAYQMYQAYLDILINPRKFPTVLLSPFNQQEFLKKGGTS